MMKIDKNLQKKIAEALSEDVGAGDCTTLALVKPESQGRAVILAKQDGVVAGQNVAAEVFAQMNAGVQYKMVKHDGDRVCQGEHLAFVLGPAQALLMGERVALNFLQRLCGIATTTRAYVDAVKAYSGVHILDTRKTTPLWRDVEKHAVVCGGGHNHRRGLYDQVLIKDNHILSIMQECDVLYADAIAISLQRAKAVQAHLVIEVEVRSGAQAAVAAHAGADIILLDNMSCEDMAKTVGDIRAAFSKNEVLLEASGGVTLDTVKAVAATGVDRISVGALTHSPASLDIAMDMETI